MHFFLHFLKVFLMGLLGFAGGTVILVSLYLSHIAANEESWPLWIVAAVTALVIASVTYNDNKPKAAPFVEPQ